MLTHRARVVNGIFVAPSQHRPVTLADGRTIMQQKLFALSLGFGGLILATHHAFAVPSGRHPAWPAVPAQSVLSSRP